MDRSDDNDLRVNERVSVSISDVSNLDISCAKKERKKSANGK